jgi:hypothetical protein
MNNIRRLGERSGRFWSLIKWASVWAGRSDDLASNVPTQVTPARRVRTGVLATEWSEVQAMVHGMLAGPRHLIGHHESRLREIRELSQVVQGGTEIGPRIAA